MRTGQLGRERASKLPIVCQEESGGPGSAVSKETRANEQTRSGDVPCSRLALGKILLCLER